MPTVGENSSSDFNLNQARARQAFGGVAFEFGDEIIAAARSLISDIKYREALTEERQALQAYREDRPLEAFAVGLAGAVGPAGLVGKGLLKAGISGRRALLGAYATEGAATAVGAADDPSIATPLIGAAAGVAGGKAGEYVSGLAGGVVPSRAKDVVEIAGKTLKDRAEQLGVTLTRAEELAGASGVGFETMMRQNRLVGGLFERQNDQNRKALGKALLERFGIEGEKITPEIRLKLEENGNALFDAARAAKTLPLQMNDDVADLIKQAEGLRAQSDIPGAITQFAKRTKQAFADDKYLDSLLKDLRDARGRVEPNSAASDAYDLLEAAIFEGLDPDEADATKRAYEKARRYWRDYKIVTDPNAVDTASGELKVKGLTNLVARSKYTRDTLARGLETDNPIFEIPRLLGQLGQEPGSFVGEVRTSMTPERSLLNQLLGGAVLAIPAAATTSRPGRQAANVFAEIFPGAAASRAGAISEGG